MKLKKGNKTMQVKKTSDKPKKYRKINMKNVG